MGSLARHTDLSVHYQRTRLLSPVPDFETPFEKRMMVAGWGNLLLAIGSNFF